jgi:hypothetical protein
MYYVDRVHLIIFNLVFIDFIWLAPRTLMQTYFEIELNRPLMRMLTFNSPTLPHQMACPQSPMPLSQLLAME